LNLKKHRCILDELEINGLIQKCESPFGKRTVTVYKPTQKGVEFCRSILEPYERLFPRRKESVVIINNNNIAEKPAIKSSCQEQEMEVRQQRKKQQELRLITSKQVIPQ